MFIDLSTQRDAFCTLLSQKLCTGLSRARAGGKNSVPSLHCVSFYPGGGGTSSGDVKGKGRLLAPPPLPSGSPASSLSAKRASKQPDMVCSPGQLCCWASLGNQQARGLPHPHLPSCPLPHQAAPIVKPALLSIPSLSPLQTTGPVTLYQRPTQPPRWPWLCKVELFHKVFWGSSSAHIGYVTAYQAVCRVLFYASVMLF